jgi:hypothetical protein
MDGWMDGWMDEWFDGCKSHSKYCLQKLNLQVL